MTNSTEVKNVLIIGCAGGLSQILCGLLVKNNPEVRIFGVDSRPVHKLEKLPNTTYKKIKYTRGNFERLFRDNKFDAVYHLGRLSHVHSGSHSSLMHRLDLNIVGTQRTLDLCLKFGIKKVIILSTFHVYGALADNPVYIKEDASLRASIKYPELRDVTEMDQLATNWMWKNQQNIETIVLRPTNIVGPQIKNTISLYLKTHFAPVGIDYDPMFQFIHEYDMANILRLCLGKVPTGIYNVAPEDTITVSDAKNLLDCPTLPVPIFALQPMANIIKKVWNFPDYLLDYIKFPCIIDARAINEHLGDEAYRFTSRKAVELLSLD